MGRTSRYKKEKTVFDVERLFENSLKKNPHNYDIDPTKLKRNEKRRLQPSSFRHPSSDLHNNSDEHKLCKKSAVLSSDWESVSKMRKLRHFAVNEKKPKLANSSIKNNEHTIANKQKSDGLKLEKKRLGESFRQFNDRIDRETRQYVMEHAKKSTRKAIRAKANREKKKEQLNMKKKDLELEEDSKERAIYAANVQPFTARVDAPPEVASYFNKEDSMKRYEKLASVPKSLKMEGIVNSKVKDQMTYEKMQMKVLRANVIERYAKIRSERSIMKAS